MDESNQITSSSSASSSSSSSDVNTNSTDNVANNNISMANIDERVAAPLTNRIQFKNL